MLLLVFFDVSVVENPASDIVVPCTGASRDLVAHLSMSAGECLKEPPTLFDQSTKGVYVYGGKP